MCTGPCVTQSEAVACGGGLRVLSGECWIRQAGMLLFVESRGVSCLRTVSVLHSSREPHLPFNPQPPPPPAVHRIHPAAFTSTHPHQAHNEVQVQGRAPLRFVASRPVRMIFDLTCALFSSSLHTEKRKNEAERIRQKYPDRIPVRPLAPERPMHPPNAQPGTL